MRKAARASDSSEDVLQEALRRSRHLAALSLAARGVVYGDIGTRPPYAIRVCFHGPFGIAPTRANVLGILSLMFRALVII